MKEEKINERAKYLAVDEEKNNRIQHLRDVFSTVYDEIEKNGIGVGDDANN